MKYKLMMCGKEYVKKKWKRSFPAMHRIRGLLLLGAKII
jgi:hypothetical protein